MNQRELIKAVIPIASMPLIIKGDEVGKSLKVEADAKYLVFINGDKVDPNYFIENERSLPAGTLVHCVYLNSGDSMDEVIRLYKVT